MSKLLRDLMFERYIPYNLKIRNKNTLKNYRFAAHDFAEFLNREPTLDDLTDETLAAFLKYLLDVRALAVNTANERAGRIKAFWNWAAKKRYVEQFPTIGKIQVPEKVPVAWREEELVRLFNACRTMRGEICGIPAWRWWFCLHGWWWCTGERIGATLATRVEHIRLDTRHAILPAEIRKGRLKAAVYRLWPDLCEMLKMILPPYGPDRELLFPWPKHGSTFYYHYGRLLKKAGLPTGRDCKPHRMRVSHASWRHSIGEDATAALGHSSPEVTRKHYLDPSLLKQDESKLFRPW